jgi:selenocysteine-specific elongation factor
VVLLPEAIQMAVAVLSELPQPFTTSQARIALDTSRRVAVPLLEYLDHHGVTRCLPDDRRLLKIR